MWPTPSTRRYRPALTQALGGTKRWLVDWQQFNSHFFTALQGQPNVMFLSSP